MRSLLNKLVVWFLSFFVGMVDQRQVEDQRGSERIRDKKKLVAGSDHNKTFVDSKGRIRGQQRDKQRINSRIDKLQEDYAFMNMVDRWQVEEKKRRSEFRTTWKEWLENDRQYQQVRKHVLART